MRKLFILFLFLPFVCYPQLKPSEKRFELSPSESKVIWEGKDFGGAGGHEGTLQLTSGYLLIVNNEVRKGDFEIDMKSIHNTDQRDEKSRRELEEHLRSEDFFSVAQFPKAFFTITKVTPIPFEPDQYTIAGFLGIKGITNVISFPATITLSDQIARSKADVVFDRTKWNVTYQSKTIFSNLKEGILSDDVKISVDLVFKSK